MWNSGGEGGPSYLHAGAYSTGISGAISGLVPGG
jgi:hypothetical protein